MAPIVREQPARGRAASRAARRVPAARKNGAPLAALSLARPSY